MAKKGVAVGGVGSGRHHRQHCGTLAVAVVRDGSGGGGGGGRERDGHTSNSKRDDMGCNV